MHIGRIHVKHDGSANINQSFEMLHEDFDEVDASDSSVSDEDEEFNDDQEFEGFYDQVRNFAPDLAKQN